MTSSVSPGSEVQLITSTLISILNYSNPDENSTYLETTTMTAGPPPGPPPTPAASIYSLRMALTIIHLLLVSIGSINLLVIFVILARPYMRSITNVYMISLCLADFMYLANLTLVAATQLNDRSWRFGFTMCTIYHGTETTGKYASVLFVVLLAADRYCAMCKANWCSRYRSYRWAITLSLLAWFLSVLAATPLYAFSEVVMLRYRFVDKVQKLCIAKWPSSEAAKWYITFSSVLIFAVPLILIVFFYYHILNKLREALKGSKRMRRAASSRAPYQRVTRLVLWVVVFHVICWSPFWLFNVFSSVFGLRIQTQFDRIVINFLHLLPYFNCALNPLLYAAHAENFRQAIKSVFMRKSSMRTPTEPEESRVFGNTIIKPTKMMKGYNRISGQSNERLLSSSLNPENTHDSGIKFKRSNANSDILPQNSKIHLSINDSTSLHALNDGNSLLLNPNFSRTSKSFDTLTPMSSKKNLISDIVSKWTSPYRTHSNGHLGVQQCYSQPKNGKMKFLDSFSRQQSSGALITESHPIHALASLNSVAITLDDENETLDDPISPINLDMPTNPKSSLNSRVSLNPENSIHPDMLNESVKGDLTQRNSVPSEGRPSIGDVFI